MWLTGDGIHGEVVFFHFRLDVVTSVLAGGSSVLVLLGGAVRVTGWTVFLFFFSHVCGNLPYDAA